MPVGQYFSQYDMPFDPDVPEADRRMAKEVAEDYDRRQRNAAEARGDKLAEISERSDREIRGLMGEENWLSLRRRIRDERTRFSDLLQPPSGLIADYTALDAQRRANVQAYFDSLNVNVTQLRRILDESRAEVHKVLPDMEADPGFATWLHDAQLPTVGRPDDPHGWIAFRAPFPGFQTGFAKTQNGFVASLAASAIKRTGVVSYQSRLDNNDAGDRDLGRLISDTQVAFNFTAPATGKVEIFIEALNALGQHVLTVRDEFGNSSSGTLQENFLMAHVLHANVSGPSFALMARLRVNTEDSLTVDREILLPGGTFGARLFSDGQIPQGRTVQIRAGTHGVDTSFTDDMKINSITSYSWKLKTVFVRIAP